MPPPITLGLGVAATLAYIGVQTGVLHMDSPINPSDPNNGSWTVKSSGDTINCVNGVPLAYDNRSGATSQLTNLGATWTTRAGTIFTVIDVTQNVRTVQITSNGSTASVNCKGPNIINPINPGPPVPPKPLPNTGVGGAIFYGLLGAFLTRAGYRMVVWSR